MIDFLSIFQIVSTALQAGTNIFNGYKQRQLDRVKFAEECLQQERTRKDRIADQNRQFEEIKKKQITDYFLQYSWPLTVAPQLLNTRCDGDEKIELKVFVAPLHGDDFKVNGALSIARHSLHNDLSILSKHDNSHPIDLLFDIWKDGHRGMQSDLDSLYSVLKGQPTLILFPRLINASNELIIYGASWGIGDTTKHPSLERLDVLNLERLYLSTAREYAKRWRDSALSISKTLLNDIHSIDSSNLSVLMKDEKLMKGSFSMNEFDDYFLSKNDYDLDDGRFDKAVGEAIANHLTVIISAVADIYYYVEYKIPPRLAIVLAYLNQSYYLDNVTQKYISIYNDFKDLTDTISNNGNEKIKYLSLSQLSAALKDCLKGIRLSATISTDDFITRILWDEYTSECFRDLLRLGINSDLREHIYQQWLRIFGQLEVNLSDSAVSDFLDNLLDSENLPSILFSYSTRHSTIKEVKTRSERASYILYEKTQVEGGVNWLIALNLASSIAKAAKRSKSFPSPSLMINESKGVVYKNLVREYKRYGITIETSLIKSIASYGRFIENIRILSDILFNL